MDNGICNSVDIDIYDNSAIFVFSNKSIRLSPRILICIKSFLILNFGGHFVVFFVMNSKIEFLSHILYVMLVWLIICPLIKWCYCLSHKSPSFYKLFISWWKWNFHLIARLILHVCNIILINISFKWFTQIGNNLSTVSLCKLLMNWSQVPHLFNVLS